MPFFFILRFVALYSMLELENYARTIFMIWNTNNYYYYLNYNERIRRPTVIMCKWIKKMIYVRIQTLVVYYRSQFTHLHKFWKLTYCAPSLSLSVLPKNKNKNIIFPFIHLKLNKCNRRTSSASFALYSYTTHLWSNNNNSNNSS